MTKETENKGFVHDTFDLIKYAWDHKWFLIIISVVAFIVSAIASSFIPPRFKSTVIMFPTASVSISKNLVETDITTSDTKDLLTFGEDEEAERLLQILNSDKVRKYICKKFNLMEHYGIDSTEVRYPRTMLFNKYKGNVSFRRTEFTSIEIEVLDEEPQLAADIANEIADYVNTAYYDMRVDRAREAFFIVEKEYNDTKKRVDQITDSLNIIRSYGISDFESQSDALNSAYAEALIRNNESAAKKIKNQLNILNKYGSVLVELTSKLHWEVRRLSSLNSKYAAAKVNLESNVTNVFIVDHATVAERKAVPKRSVITMIATFSTFALALLLMIIIDNIKARS
ncbi:MAG: hypothetical protein JW894_04220 [Bacteroidales bacterium]|nr:hypothetical protein [Bacteroidales bacterium]